MKRLITFLLAAVLLLSFAACGGGGDGSAADSSAEDASAVFGELSDGSGETSSENEASSEEESAGGNAGAWDESEVNVEDYKPLNYEYVKGMWLYQYKSTSLFREDGEQRDEADYRKLVTQVCANLQRDGYNTVYLQVRGTATAFIPLRCIPPRATP